MQLSYMLGNMQLHRHKERQKSHTKKNIFLTFSKQQWSRVEIMNDDEVRIDGRMFDVKTIHNEHDQVIVYGHYDQEEDEMLDLAKETNKKKSEHKKNLSSDTPLFFEETKIVTTISFLVLLKKDFPVLSQTYHFQYYKIENPPPRFVV